MIISEKQIMQLMVIARNYMAVLSQLPQKGDIVSQFNNCNALLDSITNQQSGNLQVIEECKHEWVAQQAPLPLASSELSYHAPKTKVVCKKCGVSYE